MKKVTKISALLITFVMILTCSAYADMSIATPFVGFDNNFDSMLIDDKNEVTINLSDNVYSGDYMISKPALSGTAISIVSGLQDDGSYDSVDGGRNPYLKAHVAKGETNCYFKVNHNYVGGYVPSTGKVVYSFDMRITPPETIDTSSGTNASKYTITSRDSGALAVGMGYTFNNGTFNLKYLQGNGDRWSSTDTTQSYSAGKWYRYRIELDMNTGKASYYLFNNDGSLAGKYENVEAIGSLNSNANLSLQFNLNYADDTDISLDNIKIEAEQFTVATSASSSGTTPVIETVKQDFSGTTAGEITDTAYYDTFQVSKGNASYGNIKITNGEQADGTFDSVDGTDNKYIVLNSIGYGEGYRLNFNQNGTSQVTSGKVQYDFDMRFKTSTAQNSYSVKSVSSGSDQTARAVGMGFNFDNNGTYTIKYLQSTTVGGRWSNFDTVSYNCGTWYHYSILMNVDTGIATYKIYNGDTLVNTYTATASVNKDIATYKGFAFYAGWGENLEISLDNIIVKSGETLDVPSECPIKIENGKYVIDADVYNNVYATSGNTTSPTLILASYAADDSLIEVKAVSAEVAMRSAATADATHVELRTSVDASNSKIASVRAFVWKNLTEMVPITDSITFTE